VIGVPIAMGGGAVGMLTADVAGGIAMSVGPMTMATARS
jgi:hypothetical protein